MMMITMMRMTTRRPATAPTISPRSGRIGINVSIGTKKIIQSQSQYNTVST